VGGMRDDSPKLRFGNVALDLERHLLFRDDQPQPLSELRWKALKLLVDRSPETVLNDELQKVLANATERTLRKHIEALRKALGHIGKKREGPSIKTEYGEGYRFIPPLSNARKSEDMSKTSAKLDEHIDPESRSEKTASSGLVALYNFVRNAKDVTGNGHDCKVVGGIRFVRAGRWYAAEFDGKTGHIEVPDHQSLRLARFTLAAWIYPTRIQTAGLRIIEKGDSNSYWLYVNPDGKVLVGLRGDGYYAYNVVSPEPLETNRWRHVAGSYDGTTLALYLDGAMARKLIYAVTQNQNDEPLMIGWKFNGIPQDRFVGFMRELQIYNRALSESEIKKLCVPSMPPTSLDWNPNQIEDVTPSDE